MKSREELEEKFGRISHKDAKGGVTIGDFCVRLVKMDKRDRGDYLAWWMYSFVAVRTDGASLMAQPDQFIRDLNGMFECIQKEVYGPLFRRLREWSHHDCDGADCSVCGDLEGEVIDAGLLEKRKR